MASNSHQTRLGFTIKERRQEQKLSQSALAKRIGIPQGTLSRLERGTHTPRAEATRILAGWLGWSEDEVLEAARNPPGHLLPTPHHGMTPGEKGALLVRYVQVKRPVAQRKEPPPKNNSEASWERFDFSGAYFRGASLYEAHLEKAYLRGARLEEAVLIGAHLKGADLSDAHLEGADLRGAHLERADLRFAHLEGADLRFAHLEEADLRGAHLEGANLSGISGTPEDRRGVWVSAGTYAKSGWGIATLLEWRLAGANLIDFENFPADVQRALMGRREGLTIFFPHPLNRGARFLIDGVIISTLGRETDCEVDEYVNQGETAYVRLTANRHEDLLIVAKVLRDQLWQPADDRSTLPLRALPSDGLREELTALTSRMTNMEMWARRDDGTLQEVQNFAKLLEQFMLVTQESGHILISDSTVNHVTGDSIGGSVQGHSSMRVNDVRTNTLDTLNLSALADKLSTLHEVLRQVKVPEADEAKLNALTTQIAQARDQAQNSDAQAAVTTLEPIAEDHWAIETLTTLILGAMGTWELAKEAAPELLAVLPALAEHIAHNADE